MKKLVSILAAALLALLICVPAYAAETVGEVPGNTEISVYAKYVDDTDFTVISTDDNGSGGITLPDGTEITVSGADKANGRIVVEEVPDKGVLDWAKKQLGDKADGAKIYYVYVLDENGKTQPAIGVTVTVKPKDGNADSVYAISDSKTGKLPSASKDGSVTFTTDGSLFYALCKDSESTPGGKSPQTNDSDLALRFTLLLAVGSMITAAAVAGKKKNPAD